MLSEQRRTWHINSKFCSLFFFRIPQKPIVFYHKVIMARSLWLKQHKCCPSNNSRIPKKLTVFEHGICTCQNTILVLFWASSFFFFLGGRFRELFDLFFILRNPLQIYTDLNIKNYLVSNVYIPLFYLEHLLIFSLNTWKNLAYIFECHNLTNHLFVLIYL